MAGLKYKKQQSQKQGEIVIDAVQNFKKDMGIADSAATKEEVIKLLNAAMQDPKETLERRSVNSVRGYEIRPPVKNS